MCRCIVGCCEGWPMWAVLRIILLSHCSLSRNIYNSGWTSDLQTADGRLLIVLRRIFCCQFVARPGPARGGFSVVSVLRCLLSKSRDCQSIPLIFIRFPADAPRIPQMSPLFEKALQNIVFLDSNENAYKPLFVCCCFQKMCITHWVFVCDHENDYKTMCFDVLINMHI